MQAWKEELAHSIAIIRLDLDREHNENAVRFREVFSKIEHLTQRIEDIKTSLTDKTTAMEKNLGNDIENVRTGTEAVIKTLSDQIIETSTQIKTSVALALIIVPIAVEFEFRFFFKK